MSPNNIWKSQIVLTNTFKFARFYLKITNCFDKCLQIRQILFENRSFFNKYLQIRQSLFENHKLF